jgi:hypothetical protein
LALCIETTVSKMRTFSGFAWISMVRRSTILVRGEIAPTARRGLARNWKKITIIWIERCNKATIATRHTGPAPGAPGVPFPGRQPQVK